MSCKGANIWTDIITTRSNTKECVEVLHPIFNHRCGKKDHVADTDKIHREQIIEQKEMKQSGCLGNLWYSPGEK